jgi:hypothetical protein
MYSRKFGLRLRGKCGIFRKSRITRILRIGERLSDWEICRTRMRSRFYVNESSFRLAACAPQSGKLAKAFGVTTAAAAERSSFLGDELWLAALAAATILSKRLSPRKSSPHGLKRRSPYVGPAGIFATISSRPTATSHAHARRTSYREAATASARARRQFHQTVDRCATNPIWETVSVRRR